MRRSRSPTLVFHLSPRTEAWRRGELASFPGRRPPAVLRTRQGEYLVTYVQWLAARIKGNFCSEVCPLLWGGRRVGRQGVEGNGDHEWKLRPIPDFTLFVMWRVPAIEIVIFFNIVGLRSFPPFSTLREPRLSTLALSFTLQYFFQITRRAVLGYSGWV